MIGIIGAGTMGKSIAVEFARYGHSVLLISYQRHLSQEELYIEIAKLTDKFGFENKHEIMNNIVESNSFELLNKCDIIIEAVAENIDIKRNAMFDVQKYINKEAIITSNTSSLSIRDIFEGIFPLENVMGLHFFNPVQVMKLVELSYLPETSKYKIDYIYDTVVKLDKEVVRVKNSPGFIVNRLLIPMINEATKIVQEGIASIEDVDKAMKFGANHPMGPLKLSDLIGNDVTLAIMKSLKEHDQSIVISDLLKKTVDNKHLGRKTKKGFYEYNK